MADVQFGLITEKIHKWATIRLRCSENRAICKWANHFVEKPVLVEENTAALSIRVPSEVKQAIQALCKTYFREVRFPGGELVSTVGFGTVSDITTMLLVRGLRSTLLPIESFTQHVKATCDRFGALEVFFEQNPCARSVHPSDFPEGSELRDWLTLVIDEEVVNPEQGAEGRWVENRLDSHQNHLKTLCRASQAVRRALGEGPAQSSP